MAWDTAGTKATAKSDYHGITVVGTDMFDRWWIPHAEGVKGTPTEVVQRIKSIILTYRPDLLLIEAIGSFAHWVNALHRELEPIGISLAIEEVSHGGQPKAERIEQLEPLWTARRIYLQPGLHSLLSQLDSFSPQSLPDHDDIIDSLAMHLGFTRPGEDGIEKAYDSPIDQEWVKRRLRMNREEGNPWRRGTRWVR